MTFYFRTTTQTNFTGICPHLDLAQHTPASPSTAEMTQSIFCYVSARRKLLACFLTAWHASTLNVFSFGKVGSSDLFLTQKQANKSKHTGFFFFMRRGLFFFHERIIFSFPRSLQNRVFHLNEILNSVEESIMFSSLLVMWSCDDSKDDVPLCDTTSVDSHKHIRLQTQAHKSFGGLGEQQNHSRKHITVRKTWRVSGQLNIYNVPFWIWCQACCKVNTSRPGLHQPERVEHFPGDSVQFNKDLLSFRTLFAMENTKEVQQLRA